MNQLPRVAKLGLYISNYFGGKKQIKVFKEKCMHCHGDAPLLNEWQDMIISLLNIKTFLLQYPHLVIGAVASSAPVQATVNFEGYNNVSQNNYNYE